MREHKNWTSLQKVLDEMDAVDNYIILRNFEELHNEKYYMDGHDDIDFLVTDQNKIKKALDTKKDSFWLSKDHMFVKINNVNVKFGLRYLGDCYYDPKWQQEMISNRVRNNGYWTMSDEDYFYSIIYHAILQKKSMYRDYKERLDIMSKKMGFDPENLDYLNLLCDYMEKKNYQFTYPVDPTAPAYFEKIPDQYKYMITGHSRWKRHKIHYSLTRPIRLYLRVKRKISTFLNKESIY